MAIKGKFYRGFSSKQYEEHGGTLEINDVACIEQDLLNEIYTIQGEVPLQYDFGTRIPMLTFELNNPATQDILREDLTKVFDNDPRVQLLKLEIVPLEDTNSLVALCTILYLEFEVKRDLRITLMSN